MKRCHLAPCAVAVLLVLLAGCGSSGAWAARVDGTSISQESLEEEMRSIASNPAYLKSVESRLAVRTTGDGAFEPAFTGQILGRQIQYVLIDNEVAKRKLRIAEADQTSARAEVAEQAGGDEVFAGFPAEYQKALIERAAEVNALTIALTGQGTGEQAAKAYYDSHKDEFTEVCPSHILVTTRERAEAIKTRIAAGEDFGAVAKTESRDTESAAKNGELECALITDISVPQFANALGGIPVGEVGGPIQTPYGFHLVKVRGKNVPAFEKVVNDARQRAVTAGRVKLSEWMTEAVNKSKIQVNPKYGTFDPKTLVVTPPVAPVTTVASTPPPSGIQPIP